MGAFLSYLGKTVLRPMLRPLARFVVGLIAIPMFRLFMRRVVRLQDLDQELEKDLEQWFRAIAGAAGGDAEHGGLPV